MNIKIKKIFKFIIELIIYYYIYRILLKIWIEIKTFISTNSYQAKEIDYQKYKKDIKDIILAWIARDSILLCSESIDDLTLHLFYLIKRNELIYEKDIDLNIRAWGEKRELIIGPGSISDLKKELYRLIFKKINKEIYDS